MNYRQFGKTDLMVSEVGFGAWAIGGPAWAGNIPIGWGETDDHESMIALRSAFDQGINFYDTADFYGLGHSEELIGKVFGNNEKVIIATKVGQKPGIAKPVDIDYSKAYVLKACEASLKRLQRDQLDYYQLHVANIGHLQQGECIEAMELLQQKGYIRYWGISLSTYNPFPEANYMMQHLCGHGVQLVFNIINQAALPLFAELKEKGYGVIARMPLQFGLLAGKFDDSTRFDENDHRSFRLTPEIIREANELLSALGLISQRYNIPKALFALSFILSFPEVGVVIPGIRTIQQVLDNTRQPVSLTNDEKVLITGMFEPAFKALLQKMQKLG